MDSILDEFWLIFKLEKLRFIKIEITVSKEENDQNVSERMWHFNALGYPIKFITFKQCIIKGKK